MRRLGDEEEERSLLETAVDEKLPKVLATVSVARNHITAWNRIYKYNFCYKDACKAVAPPRTYHCDYCGRCVIRMDHHCLWMGTCIGLLNYKFYWQFLLYASLCMFILTVTVFAFEGFTILSVLGAIFLFDFGTLFLIQTKRVMGNRIASEASFVRGEFDIYESKSRRSNWDQVFTSNALMWLLPCGKPSILQALDYGANIRVGGLLYSKQAILQQASESVCDSSM